MTTLAGQNGSGAVTAHLGRYARALGHRRSVRALLGEGVDPDYNLTDFLFRVAQAGQRKNGDERQRGREHLRKVYGAERNKTAMSASAGGTVGGYLVPVDLQYELMEDVAEESLFRPRATVIEMPTATVRLSLPDATTVQSAGTSPFFGGVKMNWASEAATRTETEPKWREVELRAHDLSGYALESNPLYQDGGRGLEQAMRKLFARSIAWYEDYAFIQGNGVGKPMGIVNAPGSATVTRQTGSSVTLQDIGSMSADLLPASWPRACWIAHPTVWPKLLALNTTAFQINQPVREREGQGPHFVLNGQPGYVSEKASTLGTKGDLILTDMRLYVVGDRMATEIDVSFDEPTAYLNNQCAWRVIARVDGQPFFASTITLQDAASAVSPHVILN